MVRGKVTLLGRYHDHSNTWLLFVDDPDKSKAFIEGKGLCSIAIWYHPDTLELIRVYRGGRGITTKLRKAQREQIQSVIYCAVAQAALSGKLGFEVELDL